METKEIKITPPDGYDVDKENSTFDCIKFKRKKAITYKDVEKELFEEKVSYYITDFGKIADICLHIAKNNFNHCTSRKQGEKLLAINKLMNVAKYLNEDWKPDWDNPCEDKYHIYINKNEKIDICSNIISNSLSVYFKTKELVKQAIEILGEDTIKLALSTDW